MANEKARNKKGNVLTMKNNQRSGNGVKKKRKSQGLDIKGFNGGATQLLTNNDELRTEKNH